MSDFLTLEELAEKHEKSYNEYNRSYSRLIPSYIRSMFSEGNCTYNYKSIMRWYNRVRSIDIKSECEALNRELNADGHNYPVLSIGTAHRIYILRRVTDDVIVGLIDIYCYNDECLQAVVPSIRYEVSPRERDKDYGTKLLGSMLENNDIEVESFYARINIANTSSLRLIRNFNPIEIGTSFDIREVKHFEIPNIAYQKKSHNKKTT